MQLNIYELLKWLKENKEKIDNSRIKTIHRTYKKGIIIELFKPSLEKKYLYLIPGSSIFLSKIKLKVNTDSFVMRLRKEFSGKCITINILDFERVIAIEAKGTSKKILVELFPPGNIIILNNSIIEYAQEYKDYGIRKIFKNVDYKTPPSNFKIPTNYIEFKNIIRNTDKKDFIRCLAIDFRLGKKYSEWLLEDFKQYKNMPTQEIPEEVIKRVWEKYKDFINNNKILLEEWTETINNSIEKAGLKLLETSTIQDLENKRKKIVEILESQNKKVKELQDKITKYKLIADFISTFSWVFNSKNEKEIESTLRELGLEVKVQRDGNLLKIEINEEKIKKLLGYSE